MSGRVRHSVLPRTVGPWVCVWGWCWTRRGICCSLHSYLWLPLCAIYFPLTSGTLYPATNKNMPLWPHEMTRFLGDTTTMKAEQHKSDRVHEVLHEYLVAGHGQARQTVNIRSENIVLSHSERLSTSTERRQLFLHSVLFCPDCKKIMRHIINWTAVILPSPMNK